MPAILYASEALFIKVNDLAICEQMQSRLAKRMLGTELSSANMAAQRMVGMIPLRAKYYNRALRFYHEMRSAEEGSLFHRSYRTCVELGSKSHYYREITKIVRRCKWDGNLKTIDKCVDEYIVGFINRSLAKTAKTCFAVPPATLDSLGVPIPTLDFSATSKTANSFLLMNAGLGNRSPRPGRGRDEDCVLCGEHLDEVHLLFLCPVLEPVRDRVGIKGFQLHRPGLDGKQVFATFWDLWGIPKKTKNVRVKAALYMRRAYLKILETR